MIKIQGKVLDLFTDRIWKIDISRCRGPYARLVRFTKLVRITLDTYSSNNLGFQCIALSYYVTLAVVPFLAFLLAVTDRLSLAGKLSDILHTIIPSNPEFIDLAMEKAGNIINVTHGGFLGTVSALTFVWTILWMMFQVERVFNNVWGIRKIPRKIYKRFGFHLLVLFISPFLVLLFGTGIAYYANLPDIVGIDVSNLTVLNRILGYLTFYVVAVFALSVMYKFIPAARVDYRCAFRASLVSALVFIVFQYLYLETQVFVAKWNAIYGVIAAIPLFLMWIKFSWQIILYGAELTYSFQNIDKYNVPDWDSESTL